MKNIIIALCLLAGFAGPALAEPTQKNTKLTWEYTGDESELVGFNVYWIAQSAPKPYQFSDVSRVQIADPLTRFIVIVDVNPQSSGGLCFAVTAYDTSGNESGFSTYPLGQTEACGWFGMTAPSGLGVE